METKLTIELPDNLNEEELKDYIRANIEDLYPAMDLEVTDFDDRSVLDDVTIIEINLGSESICVEFEVEYSAYHGCKDQNYSDSDLREIEGDRIGNILIFEKFTPRPEHTTYDEF